MDEVYRVNNSKITINQGVTGTVSFKEGDCMPSIGINSSCKNCPVSRTVRIYEYTLESQTVKSQPGGFYESFSTKLIKEVAADDNGFFEASLPPGKYTLVVIEDGRLYSSQGEILAGIVGISPLVITRNSVTVSNFIIGYKAYY